jgi:hypothetical protein
MSRQTAFGLTACIAAIWLSVLLPSPATAQVPFGAPIPRPVQSGIGHPEPVPLGPIATRLRENTAGTSEVFARGSSELWRSDTRDAQLQRSGRPSNGRRIGAIVLGLALTGAGVYVFNDSRGWAEPDFSRPGAIRSCQATKTPDSVEGCFRNTVGIGVGLMVAGSALAVWGLWVP